MTPQEKELIQSVAAKLQKSPESKKDAEAEQLINTEIGAQPDAIYKLTQAVLVQEMALKQLKEKNDYLEKNAEYYKEESNRGTMSPYVWRLSSSASTTATATSSPTKCFWWLHANSSRCCGRYGCW